MVSTEPFSHGTGYRLPALMDFYLVACLYYIILKLLLICIYFRQIKYLNRDTAVPAEGNGDLHTLICVLVVRPRRYVTHCRILQSSDKIEWRLISATLCG